MSWSGFKKAVNRAGTQVLMKTNHLDESLDEEFDLQEKNFRIIQQFTQELYNRLSSLLENHHNCLKANLAVATTLNSYYGTSTTDGFEGKYLEIVNRIKDDVLPNSVEPFNYTILQPLETLKQYNEEFDLLIKKRYRKKLDYDMLQSKLSKLTTEKEQLEFDKRNNSLDSQTERHLESVCKSITESLETEEEYLQLNSKLKVELSEFMSLRLSYLDPIFESFIKVQSKIFMDIYDTLKSGLPYVDSLSKEDYQSKILDSRIDNILSKMEALNLQAYIDD
ncbi:hypothetical protein LJB42_002446 [Komagataella kurtzmanii]|nr:hypothetical protein LJB42_002446 [Komagataella kurtzmanii]